MNNKIVTILGWYGVVALLFAYALLSFSIITSNSLSYQLLNVTGAAGITIEALHTKDIPAAILNIVWVLIGLIILIKIS